MRWHNCPCSNNLSTYFRLLNREGLYSNNYSSKLEWTRANEPVHVSIPFVTLRECYFLVPQLGCQFSSRTIWIHNSRTISFVCITAASSVGRTGVCGHTHQPFRRLHHSIIVKTFLSEKWSFPPGKWSSYLLIWTTLILKFGPLEGGTGVKDVKGVGKISEITSKFTISRKWVLEFVGVGKSIGG